MRTFLITYNKTKQTMLFKYSLKGLLIEYKLNFKPIAKFYDYFKPNFPFFVDGIDFFKKESLFSVQELKEDLSFKTFWDTFAYKHGNKNRAEKLWKLLSDVDRVKAIAYIPTYKNMLISSGKAHLYPETYLSQRRYDND